MMQYLRQYIPAIITMVLAASLWFDGWGQINVVDTSGRIAPISIVGDSTEVTSGIFRYTAVADSSVIPDSLARPNSLPYPLYRALFNQARIRQTTAVDSSGDLSAADSLLLDAVLQDTLLQRIDRRIEYDLQIPRPRPRSDIPMFSLLFGTVALFAYTRHRYGGIANPMIQSFYNVYLARQHYEDIGLNYSMASFLLSLNVAIALGVFIFLGFDYLSIDQPLPDAFCLAVCCLLVALLLWLKRGVLHLLGAIALPMRPVVDFLLVQPRYNSQYNGCCPCCPCSSSQPFASPDLGVWAWLSGIVILLLAFAYSYYRGLLVVKDFVLYHKFHFLLYLCTFEIAPWFIIVKLLR
ncbi:MAG: DUF4271 domain-containing protein [Sphingobacteriales bacterium]|nr:DUF4271 domain-containing protein [Sphingobacteriales bacterium]